MDMNILKKLGFTDKTANIYLALLRLGPSSVRVLAEYCSLNRGTTYDALKWLQEKGLVTFYKKDAKQQFVAEDPAVLHRLVAEQQEELSRVDTSLDRMVKELHALHHSGGERPVATYVEAAEFPQLLEDVLSTCEASEEKQYRIYSSAGLREYLYKAFPTFSDVRIAKGISVSVIALGDGGELRGLDQRKWLPESTNETVPTYIIIYPGKTAYISMNAKQEPIAVVIENEGVYQTQKMIFQHLWNSL
jgi:sugar-specific transcriptional regulator TrmB